MLTSQQYKRARIGTAGLTLLVAVVSIGVATTIEFVVPEDQIAATATMNLFGERVQLLEDRINSSMDYDDTEWNTTVDVPLATSQCNIGILNNTHDGFWCGTDPEGMAGLFLLAKLLIQFCAVCVCLSSAMALCAGSFTWKIQVHCRRHCVLRWLLQFCCACAHPSTCLVVV